MWAGLRDHSDDRSEGARTVSKLPFPRLLDRLQTLAARPVPPRTSRRLALAAGPVFLAAAAIFIPRLDITWSEVTWPPFVVALLVGVPFSTVVNALEYRATAGLLAVAVRFRDALRIVIIGSAANLLPLPGAALVRMRYLRGAGVRYRHAAAATAVVGALWVAVSALLASLWLLWSRPLIGVAFLAGAAAAGVVGVALARRALRATATTRSLATVVAVEVLTEVAIAFRLILLLRGLGLDATLFEGLVLASGVALAAAVAIFPAGFAVNELLSAGLAPLIGLAPAVGFAVSTINRVFGLLVEGPLAAVLGAPGLHRVPEEDDVHEPPGPPDATLPPPDVASGRPTPDTMALGQAVGHDPSGHRGKAP